MRKGTAGLRGGRSRGGGGVVGVRVVEAVQAIPTSQQTALRQLNTQSQEIWWYLVQHVCHTLTYMYLHLQRSTHTYTPNVTFTNGNSVPLYPPWLPAYTHCTCTYACMHARTHIHLSQSCQMSSELICVSHFNIKKVCWKVSAHVSN